MAGVRSGRIDELDARTLYRILWLRVGVFVVEQQAAYAELDGRELEPDTELWWTEDEDGDVVATLRILREPGGDLRIGRVVAAVAARGRGTAAELMRAALARCDALAPGARVHLDAQAPLEAWYARFGFAASGPPFVEDGIPHIPMTRRP